jgi:cephalosporin hydroxylase
MTINEKAIIDEFHDLYYNGRPGEGNIYLRTFWMQTPCLKCPLDMWIYQEIIAETRPDLIIETGTYMGGSTLFMAHMLDILGKGEIYTIDIQGNDARPYHPRIHYVKGSSADSSLVHSLLDCRKDEKRLVILDSDHSKNHVLKEMALFAPYINVGSYLIVEDTNINGHPTLPAFGEGPFEAVEEFIRNHTNFVIDEMREKFLMTFNPKGYLKRIA